MQIQAKAGVVPPSPLCPSAYLTQFNLLADLMCAHHDRKNVDALRGEGIPGAVLNALALGYHALLSRRYNVAPVGIHACKQERDGNSVSKWVRLRERERERE